MSLPELATPIRIYWDLTPLPQQPPDLSKIAADILELKILSLDITATGDSLPHSCFKVLEICATAKLGVTLTISPAALAAFSAEIPATSRPKELLLETGSIEALQSLSPLPVGVAGVSFPLNGNNWQQVPDIIRFCSESGCNRLVLPMQRLYGGEKPFHLHAEGLATIADSLASFQPDPGMKITVHDPFVWRAIFPNTPFPEGRCQAANTMLSIDPHGIVYPCPVMPILLGNLKESTLKEIARGDLKKTIRARLLALPVECTECAAAESCKGGCRGRGERVSGSWEALDPGCR